MIELNENEKLMESWTFSEMITDMYMNLPISLCHGGENTYWAAQSSAQTSQMFRHTCYTNYTFYCLPDILITICHWIYPYTLKTQRLMSQSV